MTGVGRALVAGAATLGAAGLLLAGGGGAAGAEVRWPVELRYTITALESDTLDSPTVTREFRFRGASWQDWSNVQTAGADPSCQVRRPDGRLLEGTPACDALRVVR